MAKPGPRPKTVAPKSIHIAFTDNERKILNNMGSGDVKSKIRALLVIEGERQVPNSLDELKLKYEEIRKDAKQKTAMCFALRNRMKDLGATSEEIERLDDQYAES